MMKKLALLALAVTTLSILASLSAVNNQAFGVSPYCASGVIDKTPCEAFNVEVTFKNTGRTAGTWSVNIAFEGEKWTWTGTVQLLTLKSGSTKALGWNGTVPCDAPVDSVARLVVYYNDSFKPLDWWIHVVPSAELAIKSSIVK